MIVELEMLKSMLSDAEKNRTKVSLEVEELRWIIDEIESLKQIAERYDSLSAGVSSLRDSDGFMPPPGTYHDPSDLDDVVNVAAKQLNELRVTAELLRQIAHDYELSCHMENARSFYSLKLGLNQSQVGHDIALINSMADGEGLYPTNYMLARERARQRLGLDNETTSEQKES